MMKLAWSIIVDSLPILSGKITEYWYSAIAITAAVHWKACRWDGGTDMIWIQNRRVPGHLFAFRFDYFIFISHHENAGYFFPEMYTTSACIS